MQRSTLLLGNILPLYNKHEKVLIWLASLLFCIIYALRLGQDQNWDAANYHFYNAYAFLNGRMNWDIAPAQLQTWFNPTLSVPLLLLVQTLPGPLVSVVLAGFGGVNIALVYFLVRAVQHEDHKQNQTVLSILIALATTYLAFWSPMFISELGSTLGDYFGSLLTIAALLFVVRSDFSIRGYALAGLCLGLALSLKLTNATSVIAFTLASLLILTRPGQWFSAIPRLFAAGFSALVTFLPLGGAWMAYLYLRFGNPVFPIYNNIFTSPWIDPSSFLDERFNAKSLMDMLNYPLAVAKGLHPSAELDFTDYRSLILITTSLIVALALLLLPGLRRIQPNRYATRKAVFLALFVVVYLPLWLRGYGIERYAIAIAQLIPLLIFMMMSRLFVHHAIYAVSVAAMSGFIIHTTIPTNWGRVPQGWDWFSFSAPEEAKVENRLYIMYTGDAESFVALALPASSRFVRIDGNIPTNRQYRLFQEVTKAISEHKGEIRLIRSVSAGEPKASAPFATFGLELAEGPCFDIGSKLGSIRSCPLKRLKTP